MDKQIRKIEKKEASVSKDLKKLEKADKKRDKVVDKAKSIVKARSSKRLSVEVKPVMGRPREHDRDAIALALVEWAKKDNSINLNAFCCEQLINPSKITIFANECDNFRKAYELAKAFIGYRREQMLNNETLHVKAYDLNAAVYDYFLKAEKREQAEFDAKLKAQEQLAVSEADIRRHEETMAQLKSMQEQAK